jgi:hypothetical protein
MVNRVICGKLGSAQPGRTDHRLATLYIARRPALAFGEASFPFPLDLYPARHCGTENCALPPSPVLS